MLQQIVTIEHLLQEIGLTANETKIYLTLVKHQGLTYNQIAELSSINRTTCYAVIKRLIESGLVKEDLGKPVAELLAQPPEHLIYGLEKEQAKIIKRVELVKRAAHEISKLVPQSQFIEPRINYISGKELHSFFINRCDTWADSVQKNGGTIWGFEDSYFQTEMKDFIVHFWSRPKAKGLSLKLFMDSASDVEEFKDLTSDRQFRFWKQFIDYTTSVLVYGDYVLLVSLDSNPNYTIELHNNLLAQNFAKFFEIMWRFTESIPLNPTVLGKS